MDNHVNGLGPRDQGDDLIEAKSPGRHMSRTLDNVVSELLLLTVAVEDDSLGGLFLDTA